MTTPWRVPSIKVLTTEKNNPYASAQATVNIVPDTKVKYVEGDIAVVEPTPKQISEPVMVSRGINPENATLEGRAAYSGEANVYKLLLDAYKNNPIRINDYVIMSGKDLCNIVKELTGAKNVEIEAEVDINCCGKATKYNTIKNIVCITNDGTRLDFEIEYNKDYRLLQDYKISTHLTYDEVEE